MAIGTVRRNGHESKRDYAEVREAREKRRKPTLSDKRRKGTA
jgi:hypothetical protein